MCVCVCVCVCACVRARGCFISVYYIYKSYIKKKYIQFMHKNLQRFKLSIIHIYVVIIILTCHRHGYP